MLDSTEHNLMVEFVESDTEGYQALWANITEAAFALCVKDVHYTLAAVWVAKLREIIYLYTVPNILQTKVTAR